MSRFMGVRLKVSMSLKWGGEGSVTIELLP